MKILSMIFLVLLVTSCSQMKQKDWRENCKKHYSLSASETKQCLRRIKEEAIFVNKLQTVNVKK